jgi:phosphohistidine phosphatase SixA
LTLSSWQHADEGVVEMEIVLVRHGVRNARHDNGRMSDHGRYQIKTLACALELRGTLPDLLLTSRKDHAQEAATLLSERLTRATPLVVLDALTPGCGPGGIDEVVRQARAAGVALESSACLLIVGHEGRLSDLVTELTGGRSHPLSHGGAVCVRGASLRDLVAGRGSVYYRYPTVDHQEEPLRAKVNSKMTVATFLAGFVFTALSAVLLLDRTEWPWHRVTAATTLTASLALFVASVYIYDQLGTPSGFWTDADRPRAFWRRLYQRREARLEDLWTRLTEDAEGDDQDKRRQADDHPAIYRRRHDGAVYWLMVRTSRFVFTPAVVLALIGFVALLVGTGDWRIWTGGLAGLLAAGGYASLHRPDLGAD